MITPIAHQVIIGANDTIDNGRIPITAERCADRDNVLIKVCADPAIFIYMSRREARELKRSIEKAHGRVQ